MNSLAKVILILWGNAWIALSFTSQYTILPSRNYRYRKTKSQQKNKDFLSALHEQKAPSNNENDTPSSTEAETQDPSSYHDYWSQSLKALPSNPGWKRGQLNVLTEWAVSDEANRPIVCEYEPSAFWLWTKWRGTVLSMTFTSVIFNMFVGVLVAAACQHFSESPSWNTLAVPPQTDPLIQQLHGLESLWQYQLTLTTFILTFFTSEAYRHWKDVYFTTRRIQGRINDICMLVTMGATTPDKDLKKELVDTCTRLIKLSHTFFWAATPTCSNGVLDGGVEDGDHNEDISTADRRDRLNNHAIGPILLSPRGLLRLQTLGQLTRREVEALLDSGLPPSQYAYVLLEWTGLHIMNGLEAGILQNTNSGLEENILRQLTLLRGEYFNIGDYAAGRIPLAYVQFVQILVDSLVFISPFSLYSDLGILSIPLVGLLTLFYKGLLELSKSFLDPFGMEGYPGQNIRVDVLVSELNFGAASRWVKASEVFPGGSESENNSQSM